LDATELEHLEKAVPRPRDERARAVAYLDLWEKHVGLTAVHGLASRPPAAGSGA